MAVAGVVLPQVYPSASGRDTLVRMFLWVGLASAWNLVGGFAHMFSLGHAAFFALGAYGTAWLAAEHGVVPWAGLAATAVAAVAVAAVLGAVTLRLRGHYFALATLAFLAVTEIVVVSWEPVTGGANGLPFPLRDGLAWLGFDRKLPYVLVMAGFALVAVAAADLVRHSKLGLRLLAYREDPAAARALGVRTTRSTMAALALSAALAAAGGALFAPYQLVVQPGAVAAPLVSVQMALVAIVGGLGTVWGPLLGAAVVIPLSTFLQSTLGTRAQSLPTLLFGVLLIGILFAAPEGLTGLAGRARRALAARGRRR